ncbi:hypothetical protein [Actinoplanes friuliensis]|nr:hypothetical protein [Actinoplanes friuliensis]
MMRTGPEEKAAVAGDEATKKVDATAAVKASNTVARTLIPSLFGG